MSNDPMKGANARRPWTRPGDLTPHGKKNTMNTPETTAERTARALRLNQELGLQQVPAGDAEALREYQRTHPWANITAPIVAEPYKTPAQIEEDNCIRLLLARDPHRMQHGDVLVDAPSE